MSPTTKRRLAYILLPLVPLTIGWTLWSNSSVGGAGARVEQEVAAFKGNGVPTTPPELRARLSKRSGTNAAPMYLGSISAYNSISRATLHEAMKCVIRGSQGPLTHAEIASFRSAEGSLNPIFARLLAASKCDYLDYGRAWDEGIFLLFPDLAPYRNMAQLCALAGLLKLIDGDLASARPLLLASAAMARRLGDDPTVLAAAVRGGIEVTILKIMMRALEQRPGDALVRSTAEEVLRELGPPIDLRPGIAGEVVLAHGLTAATDRRSVEDWARDIGIKADAVQSIDWTLLRFRSVRQANEATFLRYWRTLYEGLPKDPEDVDAVAAAEQNASNVVGAFSSSNRVMFDLCKPLYGGASGLLRQDLACRRLLSTALKLTEGGSTSKVALPSDPFGSGQLRLVSLRDRRILYSVGADRRDDHGSIRPSGPRGIVKDVGLELIPSKPRSASDDR